MSTIGIGSRVRSISDDNTKGCLGNVRRVCGLYDAPHVEFDSMFGVYCIPLHLLVQVCSVCSGDECKIEERVCLGSGFKS